MTAARRVYLQYIFLYFLLRQHLKELNLEHNMSGKN